MLIFLTNKVLSQRALDDNRLWEMVLEDHQKIVVLEAQLESLKTSINDLQRDLRDMKKGESRITWLVISNLMAIIIALVEVYVFHYRLLKEARLALRLLRSLRKLLSCIPTPCNAGECCWHSGNKAPKGPGFLAWVLDHLAPYHIHLSHCSCLACSFSSSYRSAEVCRVCQSDYPCAMVSGPLVQGYPVKLTHRAERRYSCKHYPCQYVAYNLAKRCKGNIIPCFESCPKDLRCVYCIELAR